MASYDADVVRRFLPTGTNQVSFNAYEAGKALSFLRWHVWLTQTAYARSASPKRADALRARQAWEHVFAENRLQRLRLHLAALESTLGDSASQTLTILEAWRQGLCDPLNPRCLGRLHGWTVSWLYDALGARLSEFPPQRARALANELCYDLALAYQQLGSPPRRAPAEQSAEQSEQAAEQSEQDGSATDNRREPLGTAHLRWRPACRTQISAPPESAITPAGRQTPSSAARSSAARGWSHFVGGLLASAPMLPVVASVCSVALFVRPIRLTIASATGGETMIDPSTPLTTGAAVLALVWFLIALLIWLLGFTSPDRASMGTYGELISELQELQPWASLRGPPPGSTAEGQLIWEAAAQ